VSKKSGTVKISCQIKEVFFREFLKFSISKFGKKKDFYNKFIIRKILKENFE
jgi:hypothetical protein